METVVDPHIEYYWEQEYPILKTNSIGPILTRLDTLLRPKLIRNMLCQKRSLDFSHIINTGNILLVKLSHGLIGEENSHVFGSFIFSKVHQAALARQAQADRKPFLVYVDEFHHFSTPSMMHMLDGTRKYGVGLTLAHQSMEQIKDAALLAALRTQERAFASGLVRRTQRNWQKALPRLRQLTSSILGEGKLLPAWSVLIGIFRLIRGL